MPALELAAQLAIAVYIAAETYRAIKKAVSANDTDSQSESED